VIHLRSLSLFLVAVAGSAFAQQPKPVPELAGLDRLYPTLDALYQDLHRNPELSKHEEKTAAKLAARLRELGFGVTEHVGGNGVVGVLRNGDGPTVLVRTDMDALPMKEKTGLSYASTVVTKTEAGEDTPVMHACGHDIHMASWVGAAALLSQLKDRWHGTLVFVGQPAEETVSGAEAMVKDGLFTRFPKPDFVLGLHDTNFLPAGHVGLVSGPASAASNAVDITFFGRSGHGAAPHRAIDPIVMASSTVMALQTLVSRENNPFEPAVVTVGTFRSGSKRNIIPEEARLELTVRSYKPEVQRKLLAGIERIAKAQALSAGAAREPKVVVLKEEASEVVVNDPALVQRLSAPLKRAFKDDAGPLEPTSSSEDFGVFGRVAGVPAVQLRIGASDPVEFAKAKEAGRLPPGPHNDAFAPVREPTIRAGVSALTISVLELLGKAPSPRS
jgi:hippurate hydrolase